MKPTDSFKPPAALSPRFGAETVMSDDISEMSSSQMAGGTGKGSFHDTATGRLPSRFQLRSSDPSVSVVESRHADLLLQERLDRELRNVEAIYTEYFDDVGFDLMKPRATVRGPDLPSLVHYTKQVPTMGRKPVFERKVVHRREETATQKFQSLGAIVHTRAVDRALFRQDYLVCGISMFGVAMMGFASWLAWQPRERKGGALLACSNATQNYVSGEISSVAKETIKGLTWTILASTILAVAAIVFYYVRILRAKRIEWCKLNGKEVIKREEAYNFWKSKLPIYMFLEILIHVIIPNPWYYSQDTTFFGGQNNSKYLELFMLTRVYTILRVLHHASPLYRLRHDIVAATEELRRANFTVGFADTMKVYCYHYTITFALMLYAFVALIGGFAVFVAERDSNNGCDPTPQPPGTDGLGFNSWLDGVYYMVVSVRTIGYGDLKPITIVGRISAMLFIVCGMFVETFLGSVVINRIAKSREEVVIDEYLGTVEAYKELRITSAMLIQALWKSSLQYKYRHNQVKKERLAEVLRQQKRRRDFLQKMKLASSAFATPSYKNFHDETKALALIGGVRAQDQDKWATDVALRTMVSHFNARGGKSKVDSNKLRRSYSAETTSARDRMPYMQRAEEKLSSWDLVERHKVLFTQDLDLKRWSEKASTSMNLSEAQTRKFTGTKKVVGKFKERRVPVGTGHKSDILLEARKAFRQSRLQFTQALSTSADFVIDEKLLLVFRLLRAAAEKVRRNALALAGLRKITALHLESIDQLATLILSGGEF